MYSVGTYGRNFEILKFLAAPETYFKSTYFHISEDKSNVCGLVHSGSQPFNLQHTAVQQPKDSL